MTDNVARGLALSAVRLVNINTELTEKANQTKLLSQFYQKLNKKQNITVICEGDSLTYGHDTVSSDKQSAPSTTTDNGISHTQTRAGITYPEALQLYLRDTYKSNSVVINKGFSGDWADASYEHWNINSHADIAFIMLGTNDGDLGASWVPESVRGNIGQYLTDMRKIIRRYINWGTAVVLMTPPRTRNIEIPTTTTGAYIEPYRHAIMILGDEFGCPVVDAETFLNGCDNSYYSDTVHLNSKGYQYFASRLMSILIGYGVKNPVIIKSGDTLSIRQTRDNFLNIGCSVSTSTASGAPEEGVDGQGIIVDISPNNELYYGFHTNEDNLILIPIYGREGLGTLKIDLDFNNEQGSIALLSSSNRPVPQGYKPASSITTELNNDILNNNVWDGSVNINTPNKFIWITNKGWHNLKLINSAISGHIYFNGFVTISMRDFIDQKKIADIINSTKILLQKPLYASYTATPPTLNSIDITCAELDAFFTGNKLLSSEYYKGVPLKVTLYNLNSTIIEYGFVWHYDGTGSVPSGGFYSWMIKQTDLVVSPTNFRTITSITFDSTNKKYVVNFGVNVTMLGSITIATI